MSHFSFLRSPNSQQPHFAHKNICLQYIWDRVLSTLFVVKNISTEFFNQASTKLLSVTQNSYPRILFLRFLVRMNKLLCNFFKNFHRGSSFLNSCPYGTIPLPGESDQSSQWQVWNHFYYKSFYFSSLLQLRVSVTLENQVTAQKMWALPNRSNISWFTKTDSLLGFHGSYSILELHLKCNVKLGMEMFYWDNWNFLRSKCFQTDFTVKFMWNLYIPDTQEKDTFSFYMKTMESL